MFYDNFIKACNFKGVSPSAALVEAGLNKSAGTRWKSLIRGGQSDKQVQCVIVDGIGHGAVCGLAAHDVPPIIVTQRPIAAA